VKAVLLCTDPAGDWPRSVRERGAVAMLPLLDRPFLQHVIEALVVQGFTRLDLVVGDHPQSVERLVGDGGRWGCRVRYHVVGDPGRTCAALRLAVQDEADPSVLLGHAACLPGLPFDALRPLPGGGSVLVNHPGGQAWSGWAWVQAGRVAGLPDGLDAAGRAAWFAGDLPCSIAEATPLLDASSVSSLLEAQRAVLDGRFQGLLLTGREVDPGVWLSRNVVLPPTTRVVPPVFLGEDVRLGADADVGPYAVVGAGAVVDRRCRVEDALVAPRTFVGEGLEVARKVVLQDLLVSPDPACAILVRERFILGSLAQGGLVAGLRRLADRLLALALLAVAWPLLLAAWLARWVKAGDDAWHTLEAVRQPAEVDPSTWQTVSLRALAPLVDRPIQVGGRDLVLRALPLLWAVARGQLALVGLPPRTAQRLRELPPDWAALALRAKAGVFWEAHATHAGSHEALYASDVCYAAAPTLRRDAWILWRYATSVFLPRGRA
jgi:carbonic anhydrase/acetyltransferase-like protein (isoleucine patch superfamily)